MIERIEKNGVKFSCRKRFEIGVQKQTDCHDEDVGKNRVDNLAWGWQRGWFLLLVCAKEGERDQKGDRRKQISIEIEKGNGTFTAFIDIEFLRKVTNAAGGGTGEQQENTFCGQSSVCTVELLLVSTHAVNGGQKQKETENLQRCDRFSVPNGAKRQRNQDTAQNKNFHQHISQTVYRQQPTDSKACCRDTAKQRDQKDLRCCGKNGCHTAADTDRNDSDKNAKAHANGVDEDGIIGGGCRV